MGFENPSQHAKDYFERGAASHHDDVAKVGWGSEATQQIRFVSLTSSAPLDGCSVLDVGCGTGALYGYIQQQFQDVSYTGIDIAEGMVALSQKNYPEGQFIEGDFLDAAFTSRYDFILSSGAFNLRIEGNMSLIKEALLKQFNLSHMACGMTLLSNQCDPEEKNESRFFYYDPVEVLKIGLSITPFVEIRHTYLQNDFTVFLWRK